MWRSPREHREKPDVRQRENLQREQPTHLQQTVRPAVPPPVTPAFEVHEELPAELQTRPGVKAPVEAYAAATRPTAKPADFNTQIATLIASQSSLREAIVLREIFGPPRGLQALEVIGS